MTSSNVIVTPIVPKLRFVPTGTSAGLSFYLDGEAPPGVFKQTPEINWAVRSESGENISLSTGQFLDHLTGTVSIWVGRERAEGKVRLKNRDLAWGTLLYNDLPAGYRINLWISQELFDRLAALIESGRLPKLDVWLSPAPRDEPALHDRIWHKWDIKTQPEIEIIWCGFKIEVSEDSGDVGVQPVQDLQPPTRAAARATQVQLAKLHSGIRSVTVWLVIAVGLLAVLVLR